MNIKKFDWADLGFGLLIMVIIGLIGLAINSVISQNTDEKMCREKGGVVFKDRAGVICMKPEMVIQLRK